MSNLEPNNDIGIDHAASEVIEREVNYNQLPPGGLEKHADEEFPESTSAVPSADKEPEHEEAKDMDVDDDEEVELISLPLSKIKKIFKVEPEFVGASQSAVFATGVATELFVQYFAEHALLLAKMDRRKKIQYKDFSNSVSSQDSLYFLSDTIPKSYPLSTLIDKKLINLREDVDQTMEMTDNGQEKNTETGVNNASSPSGNNANNGEQDIFKRADIDDLV